MKIFAVVPAYNEARYITQTINNILTHADYVVVVDDGSQDKTLESLQSINNRRLIIIRHRINLGKGAALKTGCLVAQKLGAEFIVTLDADGQHPSKYIPQIIEFMRSQKLDVVFSIRKGGDHMPLIRHAGNWMLNFLARTLFHLNLRDLWCGFRAFRSDILHKIIWQKRGFDGEMEMALKVRRNRLNYGEFIIPTIYYDTAKGVHIFHGLKLIIQMFIWRLTL